MAVTTDSAASGKQKIDISQLDIMQLNQLQQQIDQEVEFLTASINQLMSIRAKFHGSLENVDKLKKLGEESEEKSALIPLSGSMYVAGQVCDHGTVVVEVGTGYFAEKTTSEAKEYFERRVSYVNKQLHKLEPTYQEKQKMKHLVLEMLQQKFQVALASQQQGQGGGGSQAKGK